MSIVSTVGISISVYSWVICLISTVLPYWTYQDQGRQIIHAGLWKNCTKHGGTQACEKPSEGWIHSVQALMVISVIVLFLSIVCQIMRMMNEARLKAAMASTFFAVLAGFLISAAAIVFGEKSKHNGTKLSAGFYLSIISAVTSFIAAALFAVAKKGTGYTRIGD